MSIQTPPPLVRSDRFERGALDVQLRHVEQRLVRELAPEVGEALVVECVHESAREFEDARVHHFVPILVERLARQRIAAAREHAG